MRTGDTDDIACWFIDTDYDGQSFFVRHAYFLYGGKDTKEGPYDKLKKALRAEIDEGEWSKLYSATSQPFDPPKSGKIAVKVINHFGDEVLKVYPVGAEVVSLSSRFPKCPERRGALAWGRFATGRARYTWPVTRPTRPAPARRAGLQPAEPHMAGYKPAPRRKPGSASRRG